MTIAKTLFGSTVNVPEDDEEGWGAQVTSYNESLIDGLDAVAAINGSVHYPKGTVSTAQTMAAASTLTRTAHKMLVVGSGGAVTLNTTTPITNGATAGEELIVTGTDDTNTVTIQSTATNAKMNGDIILKDGDSIKFYWEAAGSTWNEEGRSN